MIQLLTDDVDEFRGVMASFVINPKCCDDDDIDPGEQGIYIPIEDLMAEDALAGDTASARTAAMVEEVPPRVGFMKRAAILRKWVQSGRTLREWRRLNDGDLLEAIGRVSATHSITMTAIGDGKRLEQFLEYLSQYWEEILAIFLKLLGL